MNWLLIVVVLVFLLGIAWGCARGFVRIGISLIATILSIVLVSFLTPYVTEALINFTPIDEMIESKCVEMMVPSITAETLAGTDLSQTPLNGIDPQQIAGMDLSEFGLDTEDISGLLGEIPKDTQIQLIENSQIPEFLKNALLENNNSEIYSDLGVNSFLDYVASYVAHFIINILAFLVTLLFVSILVRALMSAVDLLSFLPGVRGLNRAAGAVLGAGFSLIFIWAAFLIITLTYMTDFGQSCFAFIHESAILTFLYEKNVLLELMLSIV